MSEVRQTVRLFSEAKYGQVVPPPRSSRFDLREVLRSQQHKKGISAIIGKWPGDETDEQIAAALKEIG